LSPFPHAVCWLALLMSQSVRQRCSTARKSRRNSSTVLPQPVGRIHRTAVLVERGGEAVDSNLHGGHRIVCLLGMRDNGSRPPHPKTREPAKHAAEQHEGGDERRPRGAQSERRVD
jgi:hypothetical protein